MKYKKLGQTEIRVSAVAMGCWAIVGDETWGEQDEHEALATIQKALDEGINFFDTAEGYGNGYSERLLAKGLMGHRHDAVIASKVSTKHLGRDDIVSACEQSLTNLGTDYIDLYQVHWPSRTIPFVETFAALAQLKEQGKIRAIGVSNFGQEDLTAILKTEGIESNQLPYSLLWRAIEYQILPLCIENGISVLCYSPLAMGLLTGKFISPDQVPDGRARTRHFSKKRLLARHGENGCEVEVFAALGKIRQLGDDINQPMADIALAWLLRQCGVTSVIAGARNPNQVIENARAADLELPQEILNELGNVTQAVKLKLGKNPDMWQSESRFK